MRPSSAELGVSALDMTRVDPTDSQRARLLEANAHRCCVCKRPNLGLHLHHIDGNSSNTIDDNLAVLCVEDHDRHHRPGPYSAAVNHLNLSPKVIADHKQSWQAFVIEARRETPSVVATLAAYGTQECIHSLQLVMQWPDERIEYKRSFHLLDANPDRLTDEIIAEIQAIGPHVQLISLSDPLPIEHCPCCGTGYSRTIKPALVTRLTDPTWQTDSICSIYINPKQPSLAISMALRDQHLFSGSLHLCQGEYLHYANDYYDERIPVRQSPSVRAQASAIIRTVVKEWAPANLLIGTGNHDSPSLIESLDLPRCWEKRANPSFHRTLRNKAAQRQ